MVNEHQVAVIKVIGIGGAGNNAVNRMIEAGVQGVEFIVINTDAQVISASKAETKLIIGKQICGGLGAGANPDVGRQAAIESIKEISKLLENSDMIFIAAGMGGGTGTGAANIIAKAAKDLDILVVSIITTPFQFEGKIRNENAKNGIKLLKEYIDSLIIVSNDRLLEIIGGVPLKDSFKEADNILRQGVQSITDLIAVPALINLDFADIKTLLKNQGQALFGVGIGSGEEKAIEAANKAITSPLLEADFHGASSAIVNVTGGATMTLYDANDAVDIIRQAAGRDINIIFGVSVNENLEDEMIVTVIATGFEDKNSQQKQKNYKINNFNLSSSKLRNFSNYNYNNHKISTNNINNQKISNNNNNLLSKATLKFKENNVDAPYQKKAANFFKNYLNNLKYRK